MGIVALGGWFSFGCLVLRLAVVLVADALRFGLLYYRFLVRGCFGWWRAWVGEQFVGLVWRRFWICILSVLGLALVGVVIFGFVVVLMPVFVVIVRGELVVGLGAGWG